MVDIYIYIYCRCWPKHHDFPSELAWRLRFSTRFGPCRRFSSEFRSIFRAGSEAGPSKFWRRRLWSKFERRLRSRFLTVSKFPSRFRKCEKGSGASAS